MAKGDTIRRFVVALLLLISVCFGPEISEASTIVAKPGNRERVLRNFLLPEVPHSTYGAKETTLVTQMTVNRANALEKLVTSWAGPISVAVYVQDTKADTKEILSLWKRSSDVRKYASIHLVISKTGPYPVNLLRNVALDEAVTEYIFPIDVDFVTSPGLRQRLQQDDVSRILSNRGALIVPAFELSSPDIPRPSTKPELVRLVREGKAFQVHRYFPTGHVMIDYDRYLGATKPYVAKYSEDAEPYYVAKRPFPRYDERFKGRGGNKQSQVFEMTVAGFKFYVIHDAHLIHYCVKRKTEDLIGNQNKNKEVLQNFKMDVLLKYKTDKNYLETRNSPRHVDDAMVQICKVKAMGVKEDLYNCILRSVLLNEDMPPSLLQSPASSSTPGSVAPSVAPDATATEATCETELSQIARLRQELDDANVKLTAMENVKLASTPTPTPSPSSSSSSDVKERKEQLEEKNTAEEEEEDAEPMTKTKAMTENDVKVESSTSLTTDIAGLRSLYASQSSSAEKLCPRVHETAKGIALNLISKIEEREKTILAAGEKILLFKYLFLASSAMTVALVVLGLCRWLPSRKTSLLLPSPRAV